MITTWVSLALICLLGAMSPGPSFVVVARNALYRGKSAGVAAAWAHASGIGFWAFLTVTGMTVLIQSVPIVFVGISIAGGGYLTWLGLQSFSHSQGVFDEVVKPGVGSFWTGAREGAVIAFLNPKTGLFFLALFSPFVTPDAGTTWQCVMVITPFMTDGLWFSLVTLALVRPRILAILRANGRSVNRVSGVILLLFAAVVFWHAALFIGASIHRGFL